MQRKNYCTQKASVEAVQWTGDNMYELMTFSEHSDDFGFGENLIITTLEGNHTARVGDWIIKGVKGEFYPCRQDIFELTYELIK